MCAASQLSWWCVCYLCAVVADACLFLCCPLPASQLSWWCVCYLRAVVADACLFLCCLLAVELVVGVFELMGLFGLVGKEH
jgi:hypothetical protein